MHIQRIGYYDRGRHEYMMDTVFQLRRKEEGDSLEKGVTMLVGRWSGAPGTGP